MKVFHGRHGPAKAVLLVTFCLNLYSLHFQVVRVGQPGHFGALANVFGFGGQVDSFDCHGVAAGRALSGVVEIGAGAGADLVGYRELPIFVLVHESMPLKQSRLAVLDLAMVGYSQQNISLRRCAQVHHARHCFGLGRLGHQRLRAHVGSDQTSESVRTLRFQCIFQFVDGETSFLREGFL